MAIVESERKRAKPGTALAEFRYQDYREFFPSEESLFTQLESILSQRMPGWVNCAQLLQDIKARSDRLEQDRAELETFLTKPRQIIYKPKETMEPDKALWLYLASLSEDALRTLCQKVSVSYDAFMPSDPNGLYAAIQDEMVAA